MPDETEPGRTRLDHAVRADLPRLYKTEKDIARVTRILDEAEEQTGRREIIRLRRPNRWRKLWMPWWIRFKYGIHWRKKRYVIRLARNYGLSLFHRLFRTGRHVFRGIEFGLTFRCNFSCHHCLCARIDESDSRPEMTAEDYGRVVDEAMKLGALTFGLEGGEPFVFKNWEEIVKQMKPRINHIVVSTNGWLFDEELARKCSALGIDTVNFSLDSGIPELHDVFRRRPGSFERVVRAVDLCRRYGIKVVLNTVIHKNNLYTEGLVRLFEFAEDNRILVNVLFAKGVGAFKDKNGMLDEDDLEAFFKIVEPYTTWHIHHMGKLKSNHGGEGCSGVKEFINMTPYGDVINCANNHIYLGNVMEEPLSAIRDRALKESPFGEYRPCFLTMDEDFMKVYYPLLEEKGWISLEEFRAALREYEDRHGIRVYRELE